MTKETGFEIRQERDEDHDSIHRLTIAAFENSEFGHQGEADLIRQLRGTDPILSLVAVRNQQLLGHVMFSRLILRMGDLELSGMALAPMSVLPEMQGQGVGSELVRTGFAELVTRRRPFVGVVGHPDYYPRFGFFPASQFGIRHGFEGIPQEVFFINPLVESALQDFQGGLAWFAREFGSQHVDDV